MSVILEIKDIIKEYPGVKALDHMNLTVHEGEVHALMGENGAGKSTLIKVISGAIRPNGGSIIYEGKTYEYRRFQKNLESVLFIRNLILFLNCL